MLPSLLRSCLATERSLQGSSIAPWMGTGSVSRATRIPAGIQRRPLRQSCGRFGDGKGLGSSSRASSEVAAPAGCQGRVTVPTRCPGDGGGPRCHPTGARAGQRSHAGPGPPPQDSGGPLSTAGWLSPRATSSAPGTRWAPSLPSSCPPHKPLSTWFHGAGRAPITPDPEQRAESKAPSAGIAAPTP